jgi:hypothetical protein
VKGDIVEYPLISAVLGSAFETWEWYEEVTFAEGFDWDTHPSDKKTKFLTVGIEGKTYQLSVSNIMTALVAQCGKGVIWDEDLDLDASEGDNVIQRATLKEVVYG